MGPMEEKVQKKYLKDHGEPRLVAEASTFVCEWCSLTDYS